MYGHIYFMENDLLYGSCMQSLSYKMCSSMLSVKFFVYSNISSIVHTANIRDKKIRQVIAYKRLKTMENF